MHKPRILISGSRHFHDYAKFCEDMKKVEEEYHNKELVIISGGARGADTLAKQWAKEHSYEFLEFKADWNKYGKAAGPIRNRQMFDESNPDLVIGFLAPESRGTADMLEYASGKCTCRVFHIV